MVDLSVRIGSLVLKNPVLTASGTFGYGTEMAAFFDPQCLGAIITKTITLEPRIGNPMPRIAETPAGLLNSIGLANVGIDRYLKEKLPLLQAFDTAVIANIAGNSEEEYVELTRRLSRHPRVDGIEVNVSCPNVKQGGLAFGTDPEVLYGLVRKIRNETDRVLMVKLSPNVTDIRVVAKAAVEAGADALSLINTVFGMAVDIHTRRPKIAAGLAGLSGPAIKPIALAKVYQVVQAVGVPIVGVGGIMTSADALEFLITGATAVQVGTLHFIDPHGAIHVIEGIRSYCEANHITQIAELIGTLHDG